METTSFDWVSGKFIKSGSENTMKPQPSDSSPLPCSPLCLRGINMPSAISCTFQPEKRVQKVRRDKQGPADGEPGHTGLFSRDGLNSRCEHAGSAAACVTGADVSHPDPPGLRGRTASAACRKTLPLAQCLLLAARAGLGVTLASVPSASLSSSPLRDTVWASLPLGWLSELPASRRGAPL